MNFLEYLTKFSNEEDAITQLQTDIANAFEKNKDKITISPNAQGHATFINKEQNLKLERLQSYVKKIANDIQRQYMINDIIMSSNKDKIQPSDWIDIDKVLSGTIEWQPGTIYNPDSSLVSCVNDGKKYVVNIKDWQINFYDYENFIFKHTLVEMEPFIYDNSLIHSTIDFPSGNLVAFNYLPEEVEDYIHNHFKESQYEFKGRDWNKFLGETLLAANVLRTPTHIGGKIFQNNDNIISGGINDSEEDYDTKHVGSTQNDVWQTLIADRESLQILFMKALKINKEKAINQINKLLEDQSGVDIKIAPGHYNTYYLPKMNSCLDDMRESIFSDFVEKNELNNDVNPDIIITQETIQPQFPIDDKTVASAEGKEALKKELSVPNSKNDLSL